MGSVLMLVDYHALTPITDRVLPAPMVSVDGRATAQISGGRLAVGTGDESRRCYYDLGRRWWT